MSRPSVPCLPMAVALRKESVDRNGGILGDLRQAAGSLSARRAWIEMWRTWRPPPSCRLVALRKESVDRNMGRPRAYLARGSLSARRAWIEIGCVLGNLCETASVALRKESVDRNNCRSSSSCSRTRSLSARRAWIEMTGAQLYVGVYGVALRKESVDRNMTAYASNAVPDGRSPQGERG